MGTVFMYVCLTQSYLNSCNISCVTCIHVWRVVGTGERLWRRRQYCQGLKTRYCRVGLLQTAQPVKILALDTFCRSLNKQNKVRLFFWIKDLIKCKNLIAQAACCGLVGQYRILQPLLPSATPFYLKPFCNRLNDPKFYVYASVATSVTILWKKNIH